MKPNKSFHRPFVLVTLLALLVTCSSPYLIIKSDAVDGAAVTKLNTSLQPTLVSGDVLTAVTSNLTLPTTDASGATIVWKSSDSAVVAADGSVTAPAAGAADVTVTLTATITKGSATQTKTFTVIVKAGSGLTVTFDDQGASTAVTPATKKVVSPATTVDALPTDPAKTGYTFDGWWTAISGGGTQFLAATAVTAKLTVYAKWTAVGGGGTTYTVTLDDQNATTAVTPTTKAVVSPATAVDALPTDPAKTGNVFGGWWTAINGGGTQFTAATSVSASLTVYAKWTTAFTVSFNDQSATTAVTPTTKAVVSPATAVDALPTDPARTGYAFGGWWTATNGGGTQFTAATTVSASLTVYAKWTVALSSTKAITGFSFTSLAATGTVTQADHTIAISVPSNAILASLKPAITQTGASVSPASGVANDFVFDTPVTYTVTAADGSTQAYTVTVKKVLWTTYTSTEGLADNLVRGVYVSGTTIYAATVAGLSVSTDPGSVWTNYTNVTTNNGIIDNMVHSVYVSGSYIYAATDIGLSVSSDSGQSWATPTKSDNGLADDAVSGVWATGATVYAATGSGLSVSSDKGHSFTNYAWVDGQFIRSVTGVYVSGSTIYAATTRGLEIKDGTGQWINYPLNGPGSRIVVNGVYASGLDIYAATMVQGLSISKDGGASWTNYNKAVNGLADDWVYGVYVSGSTIYAATSGGLSVGQ
ncbi:MAG: InlB B-repeat-containing protein [Spirochaetales bacterium]